MGSSWRIVLASAVGAALASAAAAFATTRVLPLHEHLYTAGNLAATAAVALGGGVVGVVVGWFLHARSARGMGAVAAVTSLAGAVVGTVWWARRAGAEDETGLYLVGAIILLGVSLVALAAVCGITVAMLRPVSRDLEQDTADQL